MFDFLESLDRNIVLSINQWHTPLLDTFFWVVSKTITWFPFYLLLVYLIWKNKGWKTALWFVGIALICIALVDSTTTYFFKETIQRYRPSHNLLLEGKLHFYQHTNGDFYRGGQYGFFSSHASNNAAIAWLAWFFLKDLYRKLHWILILAVALICLSRIYLAVHYPSDILCGLVWGSIWAYLTYTLYRYFVLNTITYKKR